MCDAVSLSIASTVAGVAGTAVNSIGQMNAQKKQQRAVQQWTQEQKKFREQEKVRQEDLRREADAARLKGLDNVSADSQKKMQSDEEARLAAELNKGPGPAESGAPISAADAALAGQQPTNDLGDRSFQDDLAKKINEATSGAEQRMGALARVSSFGDSFGGLGTMVPMLQGEAGQTIDKANEFRRGSMGAFNLERAIEPQKISFTPSPLGEVFGAMASIGGGLAGKGLAGGTGGGFLPDTTTVIPTARPPFLPDTTSAIPAQKPWFY